MTEARFSTGNAVRSGWGVARAQLGFFVVVFIILAALNAAPQVITAVAGTDMVTTGAVTLAFFVVQLVTQMGIISISLKLHDSGRAEYADLFNTLPYFLRYLIGMLLYSLVVGVGLILLVVPGLIWMIKYAFTGYLIVDKGLTPLEALRESAALTAGVRLQLAGFGLALLALNIAGALALGVGLLLTIPTSIVATAHVYRRLLAHRSLLRPAPA